MFVDSQARCHFLIRDVICGSFWTALYVRLARHSTGAAAYREGGTRRSTRPHSVAVRAELGRP